MTNLLKTGDTYKFSHVGLLPKGTTHVHAYLSSRGGAYDELPFNGLQYILMNKFERFAEEYFGNPIASLREVAAKAKLHGMPYPEEEMRKLILKHEGKLPLAINALPEGTIAKPHDVLLNISNTDPEFPWLVGMMGEHLTKLWYPITVAAKALAVRKILEPYYRDTSDNPQAIDFAYHNMGDRACTSDEQAAIGGLAHLTSFKGTDNWGSIWMAEDVYGDECVGYNIPATEHSIMTSRGREGEFEVIDWFLGTYLDKVKEFPMIACVLDSYDIYKAVDYVSYTCKYFVEAEGNPTLVIRPDSGNPLEVIPKLLKILDDNSVAYVKNSKGYRVFSKYRIIWSDGLTPEMIERIAQLVIGLGYSIENVAFGAGGDIMQRLDRDTCKFAFKQSAICVDGVWRDTVKDPIDDAGKKSKAGRVTDPRLVPVFRDGELFNKVTFGEVRRRIANGIA